MKAVILNKAGAAENLTLTTIAEPAIQDDEVLVKVQSFSINPVDCKTRSGKAFYEQLAKEPPIILGWDIAGEVVKVGRAVEDFEEGDAVFGMVNFPGHGKAYAEYVAAPAAHLAHKPARIPYPEAAAATLAALTAWQILHKAEVKAGERVLVHAAAGGVGHYAVQLAKHMGAYVIGTASAGNMAFIKELGVDEAIDYKSVKFEEAVNGVDVVLDTVGGDTIVRSLPTLKEGGRLITIAASMDEEKEKLAKARNIRAERYLVHSSGEDMQKLAELMEEGILTSHVSKAYTIDQIAEAHHQMESSRTRGKIVVNLFEVE